MTIDCVRLPVESRFPVPFAPSKSLTVNVSLPMGARTCPLQVVGGLLDVQLIVVVVFPGETAIVADWVDDETYAGLRKVDEVVAAGTMIVNWTSSLCGACVGVVVMLPPAQPTANAATRASFIRALELREIMAACLCSDRRRSWC
jgi:hypothetical protein